MILIIEVRSMIKIKIVLDSAHTRNYIHFIPVSFRSGCINRRRAILPGTARFRFSPAAIFILLTALQLPEISRAQRLSVQWFSACSSLFFNTYENILSFLTISLPCAYRRAVHCFRYKKEQASAYKSRPGRIHLKKRGLCRQPIN